MLLGDSDVPAAIGKSFREFVQSRASGHRRRHRYDFFILARQLDQRFGKNRRVIGRRRRFLEKDALLDVKGSGAMPLHRMLFGRHVTLALNRYGMNQEWTLMLLGLLESIYQRDHIMSIHRPNVLKSQFLK